MKQYIFLFLYAIINLKMVTSHKILAIYPYNHYNGFYKFHNIILTMVSDNNIITLLNPYEEGIRNNISYIKTNTIYEPKFFNKTLKDVEYKNLFEETEKTLENVYRDEKINFYLENIKNYDILLTEKTKLYHYIFTPYAEKNKIPILYTRHFYDVTLFPFNIVKNVIDNLNKKFNREKLNNLSSYDDKRLILINTDKTIYTENKSPYHIEIGGINCVHNDSLINKYKYLENEKIILVNLVSINREEEQSDFTKILFNVLNKYFNQYKIIVSVSKNKNIVYVSKNIEFINDLNVNELLSLNNTLLYISNSDIFSIYESIVYKVPLLVFPISGHNYKNANIVVNKNLGLKMDTFNISNNELVENINILLNMNLYTKTITKISEEFKNSKQNNYKNIITFWIDYIIKYNPSSWLLN